MKNNVNLFIQELKKYQAAENVFNPWRDYDPHYDLSISAPEIRTQQLKQFLLTRIPGAKYLLVAEAVGYQGGKFTGIPMTSERIFLGHHKNIRPPVILHDMPGTRTSNPDREDLKKTQRHFGFTEPTATIVWGAILQNKVPPHQVITWNIYPFHPFHPGKGPLTNRTPTAHELEEGGHFTKMLLKLIPGVTVVAIGRCSSKTLERFKIKHFHVPHPANGGANKFKAAIKKILI